jgi:hypothetical protein
MKIDPELRAKKIAEWNPPIWWPLGALIALLAAVVWPAWRVLRRQERLNAFGEHVQHDRALSEHSSEKRQ